MLWPLQPQWQNGKQTKHGNGPRGKWKWSKEIAPFRIGFSNYAQKSNLNTLALHFSRRPWLHVELNRPRHEKRMEIGTKKGKKKILICQAAEWSELESSDFSLAGPRARALPVRKYTTPFPVSCGRDLYITCCAVFCRAHGSRCCSISSVRRMYSLAALAHTHTHIHNSRRLNSNRTHSV